MKLRFAPFWYDRVPASRRPSFTRQRGHTETSVAIVGGGLTGCACAWTFASAGVPVVLLEADHVGASGTAGGAGLVRHDFAVSFETAAGAVGLRAARSMWQVMRRSALDLEAVLRRLRIRCDLSPQDLLHTASGDKAGRVLRREYEARRRAGLDDYRWMGSTSILREAALESSGGIRGRATVLDPYRACAGLARAAEARGATLFEHSPVERIRATGQGVAIETANGSLLAETVIVATAARIADLRALGRHLRPRQAHGVVTDTLPARVRREIGTRALSLRDSAEPPHVVRWLRDDRVLITGAAHEPLRARSQQQALLVQRTGQLMYELSLLYPAISGTRPAWGWSFPFTDTVDGLPYVGTHRHFPRHLFALAAGAHGPAASWLAARLLVRQFFGEPAKGDELLGFGRILR